MTIDRLEIEGNPGSCSNDLQEWTGGPMTIKATDFRIGPQTIALVTIVQDDDDFGAEVELTLDDCLALRFWLNRVMVEAMKDGYQFIADEPLHNAAATA